MSDPIDNSNDHSLDHPNPNQTKFRFGLPHLFYFVALIASGLVVMGFSSLFVSGITLFSLYCVFQFREDKKWLLFLLAELAIGAIAFPLISAATYFPIGHRSAHCLNNMQQLVLALHNHDSTNSHLPPAASLRTAEEPTHSWRVAILPFVEQNNLFSRYDFSESWDGANNRKLVDQTPPCYHCISTGVEANKTNYKLVSDENAFFYKDREPDFDQISDDLSSALILVEDSENPVHWMKPEDISTENAIKAILSTQGMHYRTEESLLWTEVFGAHALFADGAGYRINPTTDPELLRQMINVNDGISPDPKLVAGPHVIYKPNGFIALALYISLLILPGWILWRQRKSNNSHLGLH